MQLYFTTVSLPINSLVDSPDHPWAFPPTEPVSYTHLDVYKRQRPTVSLLAVFFCPESKEARRAKVLPYPCENFFPILCEKSCPSLARIGQDFCAAGLLRLWAKENRQQRDGRSPAGGRGTFVLPEEMCIRDRPMAPPRS